AVDGRSGKVLWTRSAGGTISFFFSSRGRHTNWPRDWSSDVCSSDLFDQKIEALGVLGVEQTIVIHFDKAFAQIRAEDFLRDVIKIGRASCRERVWIGVGAGSLERTSRAVG